MNSNKIIIGSANFENYYGQRKNKISLKRDTKVILYSKKNKNLIKLILHQIMEKRKKLSESINFQN